MKKNGTFIANNEVIENAKGKMQWNTSTPEFRKTMQYRYDAVVKMGFLRKQANEDIKTLQKHIDFLNKQTYTDSRDVDNDNADIKKLQDTVKAAQAEVNANAPETTKAEENLYYAYKTYINGEEVATSGNTYFRAFKEWAVSVGVKPTEETFKYISKAMGKKKLSANAIAKNNGEKLTGELSPNAFLDLFYREVMECLKAQNLLRGYTFTTDYANELVKKAMEKFSK